MNSIYNNTDHKMHLLHFQRHLINQGDSFIPNVADLMIVGELNLVAIETKVISCFKQVSQF